LSTINGYTDGVPPKQRKQNEFNICGVAAGKYHLAITPYEST
jgi:hypothetical protein